MLTIPPSVRVYVATGATDMRKAIDGLRAAVRDVLREDPFSGHLFVFANRRRDRMKILVWDATGFWVLFKRLERGTFAWPEGTGAVTMTARDLTLLLAGVDLSRVRYRKRYTREAGCVAQGA